MATPDQEAINTFISITGATESVAVQKLQEHSGDLNAAVNAHFTEGDRSSLYSRKQHKKDVAAEAVKKKRRSNKKPYSRSIVGASLEVIQKRRAEKPEVRDAAREAAIREIKERIKKTKDEKKAKKAEVSKSQKAGKSAMPRGAAPKGGPKLGGGGGKR